MLPSRVVGGATVRCRPAEDGRRPDSARLFLIDVYGAKEIGP
jgi:hypothetical protein